MPGVQAGHMAEGMRCGPRSARPKRRCARALTLVMIASLMVLVPSACTGPMGLGLLSIAPADPTTSAYRGLNLYGAFQNGFSDQSWTFPTPSELDYYKSKGLNSFRVPLLWENLQPQLFSPLNPAYLTAMDRFVSECKARGQRVSFTFINQGVYPANGGDPIGSPQVPDTAFYDVWTKLALHYRDEPTVWAYDLINEPFADQQWETHAQSAINAIRTVDPAKPIIVMPRQESALSWDVLFSGYQDPANNLVYEAHIYFDHNSHGDYQGTYDQEGAYPAIGVDRITPFVLWCKLHAVHCIVGEYGVPGEPTGGESTFDLRWLVVLDKFLSYLDRAGMSADYWSAGPYGDVNSVEPVDGQIRPQMAVLEHHLGQAPAP
jgi:endoglucanase